MGKKPVKGSSRSHSGKARSLGVDASGIGIASVIVTLVEDRRAMSVVEEKNRFLRTPVGGPSHPSLNCGAAGAKHPPNGQLARTALRSDEETLDTPM